LDHATVAAREGHIVSALGPLEEKQRRALRDLALSIRVWPGRRTPTFVVLDVGAVPALRAGCPGATIVGCASDSPCAIDLDAAAFTSAWRGGRVELVYLGDATNCAVWVERLQPGGVLILRGDAVDLQPLTLERAVGDLWIYRMPGGPPSRVPYLSVITRTCRRPRQLALNIASLKAQTHAEYEHIILVDDDGAGLEAANRRISETAGRARGEWVMVLDDDDIITEVTLIRELRHFQDFKGNPDMVAWRIWRVQSLAPKPCAWNLPPKEIDVANGHMVCNCFAVRRQLYDDTIHAFNRAAAGDQSWLKAILAKQPNIFWWDQIVSHNLTIGQGRSEEGVS